MYSIEYLENVSFIELAFMLNSCNIPEWLILDEWYNEIGCAWAEYQASCSGEG
jgi:hypothetical protein